MTEALLSDSLVKWVIEQRRELHRIPEPAREEHETSACLQAQLERMGFFPVRTGGTGFWCDCGTQGPIVALRADMDGIRVQEETGLPHASRHPGLMHACGHDGHMAMLLGAARFFAHSPPRNIRLRFLFQPAEEQFGGAQDMIQAGAIDGVRMIFGAHLWTWLDAGQIASCPGPFMAQTERVFWTVRSRGGHAALPRGTGDAVVAAAALVNALQTIASRGVNLPAEPAVLTIGELHAGSAPNVIASMAELRGTLRALAPEIMEHLRAGVRRISDGTAQAFDCRIDVRFSGGYPALINDRTAFSLLQEAIPTLQRAVPVMAGEDFSYYLQRIPGCFFFVGAGHPPVPVEKRSHHHEPTFDIDERALANGLAAWVQLVRHLDAHLPETENVQ